MKNFKRIVSLLLVFAMLALCACSNNKNENEDGGKVNQIKYTTPAGLVKKTETVYVNLDNKGAVTQTIVSDWLHTTKSKVYVDDVTNLSEIENIKDDSVPDVSGSNLRWYLDATDLYYQGKSNAKLPLNFSFSYKLNGSSITPENLAGKTGKVEITVKITNTDAYTVKVNGKEMVMYNPMVVVGGISLSEAKFQNISVKNGKTVGNGNAQYAILTCFPGINDSLGLTELTAPDTSETAYTFDDTFVITADATNFEIGNFMFAALPIASLDIGLNSISTSMDDVRENLSKLQQVQQSLQSIDADALLDTLTSNPDKINNLSALVSQAANLYSQNKALIDVLEKYTTPENVQTIQLLSEYIETADFDGLEDALNVINSIFGNDTSAEKIQQGLELLREMSNDLSNPEVKAAIQNLPQTVATLSSLQTAIEENKDLIDALKVLSESDVLTSIDAALSGVEGSFAAGGLSSITNITGNADEITAKMTAWIELGKRYTIFTKKAANTASSVMFMFKAESIKASAAAENNNEKADPEAEEKSGLTGFFKKLFG